MSRKNVALILTLATVALAFFLLKAFHFSLVFYFLLTTVFLVLMCRLSGQTLHSNSSGSYRNDNSNFVAMLTYLGTALMSLMVYVNYHQARGDIYRNTDHHALAFKGYQLPATSTLFGATPDAIIQDSTAMGLLTCELVKGDSDRVDSIILRASNFHRTLFLRRLAAEPPHALLGCAINQNNTLPTIGPDGLRFHNDQRHRTLQVQIVEKRPDAFLSSTTDTAYYVFTVTDSAGTLVRRDTSAYHFFIQKSYALSTLIPSQTVSEFGNDLDGYHITRSQYLNAEGPSRLGNMPLLARLFSKIHGLKSYREHPYLLEQVRPNAVARLLTADGSADAAAEPHTFTVGLRPGERFYIGFGDTGTQPMQFNDRGQLLFDLPKYQPLPEELDQTEMFVTSSSEAISREGNISPYNILFAVDQLDADSALRRPANRNAFESKMAFARGATTDSLLLLVNRRQMVHAGQDFTLRTRGDAEAILQLTDFKATSLFQPAPFARTILWLFVIASLMILFGTTPEVESRRRFLRVAPSAEMACMVLLMVLFTTRYILCWRLSVFPPLDNVTLLEHEAFIHNVSLFRTLTLWFPLVFAACMVVKAVISLVSGYRKARHQLLIERYGYDPTAEQEPRYTSLRWRRLALLLPVAAFIAEMVARMILPRGFQILFPVAGYFVCEILLVQVFVGREQNADSNVFRSLLHALQFPFVWNFAWHLALLTIFDAGYGVMFALYGAMRAYLVYVRYRNYRYYTHRLSWWFYASLGLLALLMLFFFAPHIMAFLMNHAWAGNLFLIAALSAGLSLVLWGVEYALHMQGAKPRHPEAHYEYFDTTQAAHPSLLSRLMRGGRYQRKVVYVVGTVIFSAALVLLSGLYDKLLGPDGHYTHIRYRTKVLVENWDRTLNNERVSDDKKITRFRQTSENQWILDHYYINRPHAADPYFQRQPMSKTGAMWGAQTTDLSFLRFGIGEHGMSYAAALLVLMLAVFALAFRQQKNPGEPRREARRGIAIAALLLLLMQGIFVWMSVTNKFIFFGQDFPMLSITSKMTVFYVLFLLSLVSWLSWLEYNEQAEPFNAVERQFALVFVAILLLFCVVVHFFVGENRKNKNVDAYLLRLDRVENVLYAHNRLLRFYQLSANKEYNRLVLATRQGRNRWGQQLFRDFNASIYSGQPGDDDSDGSTNHDCIINPKGTSSHPYVMPADPLYQPLLRLYNANDVKSGAFLELSPDSVTLQIGMPQQAIDDAGPDAKDKLATINNLFYDYQLERRSLYMKRLSSKSALATANNAELQSGNQILETGDATAFVADYLGFIRDARANIAERSDTTLKRLIDGIDSREVSGATFTNSLIDAYLSTYSKNNSPANIIYLKRDHATGYLQFCINREFFSIPKLGNPLWRGDIVSSDALTPDLLFTQGNDKVTGQSHANDHFSIARLPASWLMGEKDQYLFHANQPIDLRLNANEQLHLPSGPWTTLRLADTDGATIIQSDGTVSIQMPSSTYHVLAKNVWVNGQRRLIYPLGKTFYWMRPYSEYVSVVMRDSVLISPDATARNHVVSIDFELTRSLYSLLEGLGDGVLRTSGQKGVPNYSVFVGNSDGEILALSDYNANPLFRVDPNDQRRLQRMRWRSSLFGDYSEDRGLNGNFNLMPLMIGPGSSLKPITFAATATTVDEDWNNFHLVGTLPASQTEREGRTTYYVVRRYAGKDFNTRNKKDRFRSISSDEPDFGAYFDVAKYLYKSSNYFNSVMATIGSFSEASLQGGIFADAHADLASYGVNEFPVMRRRGRLVHFAHTFDPQGADAEPILMKRYSDLFGVYSFSPSSLHKKERNSFMSNYLDHNTLDPALRATSLHVFALRDPDPEHRRFMQPGEGWALPEASFIDFKLRANPTDMPYSAQIKTLTLGMRRIVSVSPLKMGEMFSRVFLLDRNFRFTLSGQRQPSRVDFLTPAYASTADYLRMLQGDHSFFLGLRRCAMPGGVQQVDGQQQSFLPGTASYLSSVPLPQGLHVYAKTGTIDNSGINQSNLLAVVITNGDMRRAEINDQRQLTIDGRPVKFYVVYLFMDKTLRSKYPAAAATKQNFQRGAVQRVVESKRFLDFFRNAAANNNDNNNE